MGLEFELKPELKFTRRKGRTDYSKTCSSTRRAGSSECRMIEGVEGFFLASKISISLGSPTETCISDIPAKWNTFNVI